MARCGQRVCYIRVMVKRLSDQGQPDRTRVLRVRISPQADDALGDLARREARSKSDTVRLMLTYAAANMPKGYTGR